jgi:hypothetical protein
MILSRLKTNLEMPGNVGAASSRASTAEAKPRPRIANQQAAIDCFMPVDRIQARLPEGNAR